MAIEVTWIRDFAVLVPLAVVAIAIVAVRTSVFTGSLLGIAAALLMSLYAGFGWQLANVQEIGLDSLLLTASVAMVIVPGLTFAALVRSHGLTRRLADWVRQLPVTREAKTLLVLLGLAPAVESLTGFGVSILLTVPILYPLHEARTARLGLLSMNIMPWGTLGLATSVGAMLVGCTPQELGILTSFTSALVFPYLGAVSAWFASNGPRGRPVALGLALGSLLSLALMGSNRLIGVEAAGVISGFVVCAIGLWLLKRGPVRLSRGLVLLWPFMLLLGLVLVQRLTPGLHEGLTAALILQGHKVEFHPLVSPGILLALAALALFVKKPSCRIDVKDVTLKASRILASVGLFLLLSQILVQTGMLAAFVTRMSQGITETGMIPVTVLLGALSGFTTGSNLGGNALLIGAHGVGPAGGDMTGLLLAALQNSSAGHAVFASVPMIVLLLGILRDESGGSGPAEHELLRFALRTVMGIFIVVSVAGYALSWMLGDTP